MLSGLNKSKFCQKLFLKHPNVCICACMHVFMYACKQKKFWKKISRKKFPLKMFPTIFFGFDGRAPPKATALRRS